MGRIVSTTYMTLDGDVVNMADWHFDFVKDEAKAAAHKLMFDSDALIMGRSTYEMFAPAWSERDGADEFADRFNAIRKYVVSTTLRDPEWSNTSVISDNVAARIREIKAGTERDILQYGFGPVTRLMLANGLVDEVKIWLHPVISGKAAPGDLLYRDDQQTRFVLNGTETHSTGLIILSYTPVTVS